MPVGNSSIVLVDTRRHGLHGAEELERFSFECRKTKTKVITLTNHDSRKQSNEPIRTRIKYMSPAPSAGKRVRVNHDWFWFYFWLVEEVARDFLTNHKA